MTEPALPLLATLGVGSTVVAVRLLATGRQRLTPRLLGTRSLIGRRPLGTPPAPSPRSLANWKALVVSAQDNPAQFQRRLLPRLDALHELAGPDSRSDPAWIRLEQSSVDGHTLDLDDLRDWLSTLDEVI
ncbi:MAG: hypothetical protein GY929_23790 [Actinomycetia bacterium]|nr:hypothetical protein [Actinomycetes bacterium]